MKTTSALRGTAEGYLPDQHIVTEPANFFIKSIQKHKNPLCVFALTHKGFLFYTKGLLIFDIQILNIRIAPLTRFKFKHILPINIVRIKVTKNVEFQCDAITILTYLIVDSCHENFVRTVVILPQSHHCVNALYDIPCLIYDTQGDSMMNRAHLVEISILNNTDLIENQ
jgi:hypothetical protein